MTRIVRDERGIALAIAIFALVVVGALVAGAFFAGTQELRLGDNARRATQSFGVAETGLAEQIRLWDPTVNNQVATYPADSVTVADTTTPGGTGSYGGFIYKLNDNLYLIDVAGSDTASRTGRIAHGGARQRLGLLGRTRLLDIDIQAGLTTQGNVQVLGNARVDGHNLDPTGWTNCAALGTDDMPDTTGVRTTGNVEVQGQAASVDGAPEMYQDSGIDDGTFTVYGDVTFDELASLPGTKRLPEGTYTQVAPRVAGGVCDRAHDSNWGDGQTRNPDGLCSDYFPIVYIDGNLSINGLQGQGILLVRGNMSVQGPFEYFGIAIVLGEFSTAGGGNSDAHFWGGVLARNASLDNQSLAGSATLNYSACAILTVLNATGTVAPLRSRGWVQLF